MEKFKKSILSGLLGSIIVYFILSIVLFIALPVFRFPTIVPEQFIVQGFRSLLCFSTIFGFISGISTYYIYTSKLNNILKLLFYYVLLFLLIFISYLADFFTVIFSISILNLFIIFNILFFISLLFYLLYNKLIKK